MTRRFQLWHLRCLSCSLIIVSSGSNWEDESLPGWMGETYHSGSKLKKSSSLEDPKGFYLSELIQLSSKPRIFLRKNFISNEECDHMVNILKPTVEASSVVDHSGGKTRFLSNSHKSLWIYLKRSHDAIVARVEARIASWTSLPEENGELIKVMKQTADGVRISHHFDFMNVTDNQRLATVVMYLSNPEKGGETNFPLTQQSSANDDTYSECAKTGISVKPRKGDALLFFSLNPDLSPDYNSFHGGCPVIRGEKWYHSFFSGLHANFF